jgi:hypothetical protein
MENLAANLFTMVASVSDPHMAETCSCAEPSDYPGAILHTGLCTAIGMSWVLSPEVFMTADPQGSLTRSFALASMVGNALNLFQM